MAKKNFLKLPTWLRFNAFYRADLTAGDSEEVSKEPAQRTVVHPYDANLISSERADNTHMLFLDLDVRHFYSASTNPEHAHLMLDTKLSTEALKEIVDVLAKHGILQQGIKQQLERDGHLSLRMPGMNKYTNIDNQPLDVAKEMSVKPSGNTLVEKFGNLDLQQLNPFDNGVGLFQTMSSAAGTNKFMGKTIKWVTYDPPKDMYTLALEKYGKIEEMQVSAEIFTEDQHQALQEMAQEPQPITFDIDVKVNTHSIEKKMQELYDKLKEEGSDVLPTFMLEQVQDFPGMGYHWRINGKEVTDVAFNHNTNEYHIETSAGIESHAAWTMTKEQRDVLTELANGKYVANINKLKGDTDE